MNGDAKTIYNAILQIEKKLTELEVKQEERHSMNIARLLVLDNLRCDTHAERMKGMLSSIGWLWGILSTILLIVVGTFIKHIVQ